MPPNTPENETRRCRIISHLQFRCVSFARVLAPAWRRTKPTPKAQHTQKRRSWERLYSFSGVPRFRVYLDRGNHAVVTGFWSRPTLRPQKHYFWWHFRASETAVTKAQLLSTICPFTGVFFVLLWGIFVAGILSPVARQGPSKAVPQGDLFLSRGRLIRLFDDSPAAPAQSLKSLGKSGKSSDSSSNNRCSTSVLLASDDYNSMRTSRTFLLLSK